MDQSNRYADLSLKEEDLIKGEGHILVAYKMKPKPGFGTYLAAAAHFAAESSTGTNVEVSTTDDFTRGVDALVYYIDEANEDMRIATDSAIGRIANTRPISTKNGFPGGCGMPST